MIEIKSMSHSAINELLTRVKYGHLGCAERNHPYVVPIHFGYDGEFVYIFTTEGRKTEIINANPEVCLQVEEVLDKQHWQSVMIVGNAEKVTDAAEREKAMASILAVNPDLTPALSIRWMDPWVQEVRDIETIYRVKPSNVTGRRTVAPDAAG
jgi:nitroimidazol reductase NimA-like FMN-containing flavoprotein (pyridoxamine 5'-phosphate oxidase superfamily)